MRPYHGFMQTLTLTQERQNLTRFVRKAIKGEDVGLVCDGRIVAFRLVEVHSSDYCLQEYGVTLDAIQRVVKSIDDETEKARAAGKVRVFTGKL